MSEWISVNERLPEKRKKVLVYFYGIIDLGYFMGDDGWYYVGFEADHFAVTHWMPLPNLPRKGP